MKSPLLLCIAILFASALAATDVSGNQSGLWTLADSPYNIVGDVTVPTGTSLNIEPGVEVYAMGNWRITAQGRIYALGTEADSIRFMSGQTDPNALWKGIRLEDTTQGSQFGFCYVEKAEYGINSVNSPVLIHHSRFNRNQKGMQLYGIGAADPAEAIVSTNLIEYSIQNGILIVQNSNAVILDNELRYNGTGTQYMAAIQLSNQSTGGSNDPEISTNHIHHNFKQGITAWDVVGANAINPDIHDNIIEYNLTGIYLLNASGYVSDNIIRHNFIAGDANSGAGVMVAGATSAPYFERNEIYGNFTGFYLGTNAQPCLGNLASNHAWAQGENRIFDNIDESDLLHSIYCYSYSNSALTIYAENNWWGTNAAAEIPLGINDHADNAALPTVDFEPFLTETENTVVNGWIEYNGSQDLANHRLQFVDTQTGEILQEFPVDPSQPFSFAFQLEAHFRVVALADVVGLGKTLYGSPGGLLLPGNFAPNPETPVSVGGIELEDTQPPRYQEIGEPEIILTRTVFPVYNRFFVYHWEYINWLYQEGDFLYLMRHTRYNDAQNIVFFFPDGLAWDKIANLQYGDTWTRIEILDDSGTQRLSEFSLRQVADQYGNRVSYDLVTQRAAISDSLICQRLLGTELRRLYHYRGSYLQRAENIVADLGDQYLEQGNTWSYYPIAPGFAPTQLCFDQPEHSGQINLLTLFWQAPEDDGLHDWTHYNIYNYGQMFEQVPFGQNWWHTDTLLYGTYLFTVRATDGTEESDLTNSVLLQTVASGDPIAAPPLVTIAPNPVSLGAQGSLKLNIASGQPLRGKLSVYNQRGQLVKTASVLSEADFNWTWDLRGNDRQACASGIYLIRVELAGARTVLRKAVLLK